MNLTADVVQQLDDVSADESGGARHENPTTPQAVRGISENLCSGGVTVPEDSHDESTLVLSILLGLEEDEAP